MKFRNYLAVLCALASPVVADDQALVIANGNYLHARNATGPSLAPAVAAKLRASGYRVEIGENLTKHQMDYTIAQFAQSASPKDHVVYVFLGHTLNADSNTYLTPVDLNSPSAGTIENTALNLNVVTAHAAKHSGASAIFLGWTKPKKQLLGSRKYAFSTAPGLRYGLGEIDVPQGVLVVNGIVQRTVNAIETQFFEKDRSTRAAGNEMVGYIRSQGYLSLHAYLNRGDIKVSPTPKPNPRPVPEGGVEQSFWEFTKQENTIPAYQAFIKRFPNGRFTALAKKNLANLRAEASISPAERAERALNLTRDEKRDIQRALTVLGHDTRGVDGLFGPASRRAISRWQAQVRRATNGFLDGPQIRQLLQQGKDKRRALLEEAKRKRIALEARDRDFWRATGASGQEYDLRVYLNEFPDGVYAEVAQSKLDKIIAEKTRHSGNADRKAWNIAASANTDESYHLYLRQFKTGNFAEEAKARIRKLRTQDANRKKNAEALRVEKAMNLGPKMWLIVERQMANVGLKTGNVDGVVDGATRSALRQFQQSNGLPATGYMNPITLSRVFIR
jgi:peptidoglycan hydrolase-like protein with peptidoglycan-binding domain